MFVWGIVLFCLGITAVLDSQFNYGYVFRSTNSTLFMLVSLGVLIRTRMLSKKSEKERLRNANTELESKVEDLEYHKVTLSDQEAEKEVSV